MGYHTSNAAYAYDMQPDFAPDLREAAPEQQAVRPQMGVVNGAGREADQEASPAVWQCFKVFCVLVAVFFAVGMVRVGLAGLTATVLNENATLSSTLESAQDESADLEVMRSIYGSSTRIRELAESYGMVVSEDSVTLDFTEYVSTGAEDEDAASTDDADADAADDAAEASSETDAEAQETAAE